MNWLVQKFREHLQLPDPGAVYVLMGAVAANLYQGEPVWPMLVGPPACGKTELLNSLLGLPGVYESARISNESAFLSATKKLEWGKDAKGGILRQVGDHGAIVINDFTSVLTLRGDCLEAVLGVFRETYSGRWTREVGASGGMKLQWFGKVAFLGGVTGAIDRFHQANASLGERWIYYRFPELDSFERSRRALQNTAKGDWRPELRDAVRAFFAGLDLGFGSVEKRRDLSDREMLRVINLGTVAARCRSAVTRDAYTREIISAKETENETRIVTVLGQLLIGMEAIGVEERDRWRLMGKVALDSMPKLRRIVIDEVRYGRAKTLDDLVPVLGCSKSTAHRTVEDLEVHGILKLNREGKRNEIELSEWMAKEMKKGAGYGLA